MCILKKKKQQLMNKPKMSKVFPMGEDEQGSKQQG